jgi:lipid-binding SYLF domain-containing protein
MRSRLIALEGGSFGLQLGGQATDFVLLVMNPRGAEGVLTSKVKLGADAAAAAGPKGRDAAAATDATMRAEILTYSRSRGLFAAVSLEGSTLAESTERGLSCPRPWESPSSVPAWADTCLRPVHPVSAPERGGRDAGK